jgi:hypothetical protein
MSKPSGVKSLPNPATYLYAALRAFVSSAYERVNTLLCRREVFNFGPGTPYPDLTTLLGKLRTAAEEWKEHNAFIADLIRATADRAVRALKAAATDDDETRIALDVFRALTNYFFCYIKVDRTQNKAVSTVRVLFPVDFECEVCPLRSNTRELCANSCFRLAFFPHKPEEMIRPQEVHKYDQHYEAAQFALADASFAAAIPDLNPGSVTELSLAALMVPLLFGEPLLLTDARAVKEEYKLPAKTRTLVAHCRFGKMNEELGIRSEAFLPIKVERSFMPGFYGGLSSAGQPADTPPEEWVPDFPNSSPFCIELYSPLPDWFAHASDDGIDRSADKPKYFYQRAESDPRDTSAVPPIPRIYSLHREDGHEELSAVWKDIGKVLALGFNSQHYSELMANQFVKWLRAVFKNSTYDPFTRALKKRYKDYKQISEDEDIPAELSDFFNYLTGGADLLADVLNEIHHGMLLHSSFATAASYDLTALKGIQALAKEVDAATVVERLNYKKIPFCLEPIDPKQVSKILRRADKKNVLSRLVAEVIRNHNHHRQENLGTAVSFHACFDDDQKRYSLHFCSPGVHVGLTDYLNLRQGLPHLRQDTSQQSERRLSGIGLALSRVIAEEYGFEYVLGLGRSEGCTPAAPDFAVEAYRRDLHTRIYFGDTQ